MGKCKFCTKWVSQPEGKKKKDFCNSTCRSNYWYAENKKGKVVAAKPDEKGYDAPKLPDNFTADEPLSFAKMRQQIAPVVATNDFFTQMDKAQDLEELETVGRRIKASGMNWKEQQQYHNYGKMIANKKFL